jgi:hypothetical protein
VIPSNPFCLPPPPPPWPFVVASPFRSARLRQGGGVQTRHFAVTQVSTRCVVQWRSPGTWSASRDRKERKHVQTRQRCPVSRVHLYVCVCTACKRVCYHECTASTGSDAGAQSIRDYRYRQVASRCTPYYPVLPSSEDLCLALPLSFFLFFSSLLSQQEKPGKSGIWRLHSGKARPARYMARKNKSFLHEGTDG